MVSNELVELVDYTVKELAKANGYKVYIEKAGIKLVLLAILVVKEAQRGHKNGRVNSKAKG